MRDHDEWTDRLSEYIDGSLEPGEVSSVERHLEGCGACRSVVEDLRAIREAAGRLEDVPPEEDLWPAIHSAIGEGDVRSLEAHRRATAAGRKGRGIFLSYAQMAAAAAGLLLLGGGGAWTALSLSFGASTSETLADGGSESPPAATAPAVDFVDVGPGSEVVSGYAAEVERLEKLLEASRDRLEPATIRVVERNLVAIDRAIADSMEALREDPGNAWVRDHLRRSMERKVTYLREAADLADWSAAD